MIGDDPRADGVRAQQLLDDEMLQLLLGRIERSAVDALANTTPAEMDNNTLLIRRVADLQAARALPETLKSLVTTGKTADRKPPAVA